MRKSLRRGGRLAAVAALLIVLPSPGAPPQDGSTQFTPLPQGTIEARLRRLAEKNEDREKNLKELFQEAGCKDELLAEQRVKNPQRPNVICTLAGNSDSEIVIGAHFDKVHAGDGVVDNWSGAALLPSLFQSLVSTPREHKFVFIGFTDEEEGLVGSIYYVKHLTPDEAARIKVMINLDSLGAGPTKVWLTHSDKRLASMLGGVAQSMQIPIGVVNADQVGDDDSTSFRKRNIPTVMIHAMTQQSFPILHTSRDTMEAIHLSDYYQTYRLVAAYLGYLDQKLD